MVQQEAAFDLLKGQLRVTVAGKLAGEAVEIPSGSSARRWRAMSSPAFSLFAAVEGMITLPQGFEPEHSPLLRSTTGAAGWK